MLEKNNLEEEGELNKGQGTGRVKRKKKIVREHGKSIRDWGKRKPRQENKRSAGLGIRLGVKQTLCIKNEVR